jgi:hypothetical protein
VEVMAAKRFAELRRHATGLAAPGCSSAREIEIPGGSGRFWRIAGGDLESWWFQIWRVLEGRDVVGGLG